ncbi:WD40 repeat domain-containing protein [Polyangium aurulentum]|uniref:WD40 repeat domain-containing protein n=1 Tax=Polyangium aurulentum TaxID=2567896 RepID=UPI0010AE468C|nr:WD40 repeat domain-containing protein [Polyangium aurulentum]UQA58553.1 WD40 repeat domain-containing protein [Polyangium aurulentum]
MGSYDLEGVPRPRAPWASWSRRTRLLACAGLASAGLAGALGARVLLAEPARMALHRGASAWMAAREARAQKAEDGALDRYGADPRQALQFLLLSDDLSFRPGWEKMVRTLARRLKDRPIEPEVIDIGQHVEAVAFSGDGRHAAYVRGEKTVVIVDLDHPDEPRSFNREGRVHSVAMSADGEYVYTVSGDGDVVVQSESGAKARRRLHIPGASSPPVVFSADGRRVAFGDSKPSHSEREHFVRVWDVEGGREIAVLRGHEDSIRAIAWSPDGQRLATASADRTARIWPLDGGNPVVLRGHAQAVSGVAWSPDGQRLVTGAMDSTVQIFRASGERERMLEGHRRRIAHVAWSPAGGRIATSSWDGTLRIWDVRGGGEPFILETDLDTLAMHCSPDGARLFLSSRSTTDARIEVYTIPPHLLRERLRARVGCLPVDMRKKHLEESEDEARRAHEACVREHP